MPARGEQDNGRQIGRLVRGGIRNAALLALAVKGSAGMVEAVSTPNQAANRGSDRGISTPVPGHSINTLGRPDDGGKNSSIAEGKGKTPGFSPSAVSNSIPPSTIEGKYVSDHYQSDNGNSHVVFANTEGGKNIGPDSRAIAEYNATASRDWSAPSTGKNLDRPKAPPKFETPVPYDGSPDLLKGIEDTGLHTLEAFLYGGPILAACNPIPVILAQGRETKTPATGPTPTLSPVSEFSEQPLAGELVAKLAGRVTDSGYASESDYSFIDKFMRSKGVTLTGIVGSREVQNYTVVMPVSRDLLDTWKQGSVEPLTYIQNTKTGEKYDLIPAGKIGANIIVYRMIKIAPESMIVRFQNPDGTFSLPARILKGDGSIDPVLGKAQGDRIWFGGLGAFYDGSLLPANAPDTTDYLKQHASAIAKFALERYAQASDAKLLFDKKFNLNLLPYLTPDGNIHLLIKEETESGPEYDVLNSSGGFARLQAPPSGMKVIRESESGRFVYARQGPNADDPWYAIAFFDPDANSGSGAMVNIPATPTPLPTATETPRPTETPIPRMAPLHVEGREIHEKDGKNFIPIGASVLGLASRKNLPKFFAQIALLDNYHVNTASIPINAAYFGDVEYVNGLAKGIVDIKKKGIRVDLVLWGFGDGKQLLTGDNFLLQKWQSLWQYPEIAKILGDNVDSITPLSEVAYKGDGKTFIEFSDWYPIANNIIIEYRKATGSNALGIINATYWGAETSGIPKDLGPGNILGLHVYNHNAQYHPHENWLKLLGNYPDPIMVTEFGFNSDYPEDFNPVFFQSMVKTFEEKGVGVIFWDVGSLNTRIGDRTLGDYYNDIKLYNSKK